MDLTSSALRDVLHQVESDEAAAIDTLCALLETLEESRRFDCLAAVREVVKQWQNQPPRAIVTSLLDIQQKLNA